MDELTAQLAPLRGIARAADGSVSIETDATGEITRLYLADYAMDDGADHLAATIIDRHRVAMNIVDERAAQVFAAFQHRRVETSTAPSPSAYERDDADSSETFTYVPSHLRRD
ncbi:YbaB/EbfC family nucleoid-associated protein [Nocardia camponoti]|nr:YbaB/EbfC family nucleoid-associated protein [Nocardia camponoti]